ncbi:MAG: MarR family winged helix-turn-helix transcriptional regulator [Janthinobacterium lividum]
MQPKPALRETLDLERYVPALLSLLSNKLSAAASRECRAGCGLGYTDWRVLAQIAVSPHISAARLCALTGLDKAAVSRSFAALAAGGLLRLESSGRDRKATLSAAGERTHAGLLALAVQREQRLLAGFSEHDAATLRRLLQRLAANLPALDAARPRPVPQEARPGPARTRKGSEDPLIP